MCFLFLSLLYDVAGAVLCSLLWRCERIQQHLSSYLESIPVSSSIFSCPHRFITTYIIHYRRTTLTSNVRSHILYFSHCWLDIYMLQILAGLQISDSKQISKQIQTRICLVSLVSNDNIHLIEHSSNILVLANRGEGVEYGKSMRKIKDVTSFCDVREKVNSKATVGISTMRKRLRRFLQKFQGQWGKESGSRGYPTLVPFKHYFFVVTQIQEAPFYCPHQLSCPSCPSCCEPVFMKTVACKIIILLQRFPCFAFGHSCNVGAVLPLSMRFL